MASLYRMRLMSVTRMNMRMLHTSLTYKMPRGTRHKDVIKHDEEDELGHVDVGRTQLEYIRRPLDKETDRDMDTNENKWQNFLIKSKLSDDNRIPSQFGSIRFDTDNAPTLFEEEVEHILRKQEISPKKDSNLPSFYFEKSVPKESSSTDFVDYYFENDDSIQHSKSFQAVESVAKIKTPEIKDIKEQIKAKSQTKDSRNNDLNYFDEISFGENYRKFDSEAVNQPRQVNPGPVTGQAEELMKDLSFIDEQYLSSSPMHHTTNVDRQEDPQNVVNSSAQDTNLEYKDVSSKRTEVNEFKYSEKFSEQDEMSNKKEVLSKLNKAYELKNSEQSALKSFERKISESEELKVPLDRIKSKNTKKTSQENMSEETNYFDSQYFSSIEETERVEKEEIINPPNEFKKSKSKHQKENPKEERKTYSALSYVRNLRKENKYNSETEKNPMKDPVLEIGRNITARISDASLVTNAVMNKKHDEEEELNLDTRVYTPVNKYQPPDLKDYTSVDIIELLQSKVLYNDNEIVALWKPYGLPMFGSGNYGHNHTLEKYLPNLAEHLGHQQLLEVHRLDATTTGVVLMATSAARRKHLKHMFQCKEIIKTYLAITNGVPKPKEGIVDIPIGPGKIDDRFRQTLRPDYASKDNTLVTNKKSSKSESSFATTEYRVLSFKDSAALVEVIMMSGVKHQIRVHLGLGLGTPILGDSKYWLPDRIGPPQKVKGDIVNRLGIKRSRTRNLPIFLHSRRISIPNILPDKKLTILASKPHFFNKTLKKLKLQDVTIRN